MPNHRSAIISLVIVAVGLLVGGFMTLGVTGALFAVAAEVIVAPLRGVPWGEGVPPDRSLGVAFLLALLAPPAIPIGYWISSRIRPLWHPAIHTVIAFVITWIWSAAAVLFVLGTT